MDERHRPEEQFRAAEEEIVEGDRMNASAALFKRGVEHFGGRGFARTGRARDRNDAHVIVKPKGINGVLDARLKRAVLTQNEVALFLFVFEVYRDIFHMRILCGIALAYDGSPSKSGEKKRKIFSRSGNSLPSAVPSRIRSASRRYS